MIFIYNFDFEKRNRTKTREFYKLCVEENDGDGFRVLLWKSRSKKGWGRGCFSSVDFHNGKIFVDVVIFAWEEMYKSIDIVCIWYLGK